jgi:hypothetical protein
MEVLYEDGGMKQMRFHVSPHDNKKVTIDYRQDCTDLVDRLKEARNDGVHDNKKHMRLFASIPNTIVVKLKSEGIDIFRMRKDPAMRRRFLRAIHFDYPWLKAMNGKHL